mgnify:CR=1 FL=1
MAGVSTKAIKLRIKSMESTRQITKAMELVAASKLRSAQSRAIASRPYFGALYEAMNEIYNSSPHFASPYLQVPKAGKPLYIVIAGDRGLAGGYNNNVFKLAYSLVEEQDAVVLPIGKKAVEFFQRRGVDILTEGYAEAALVSSEDCYAMANLMAEGFLQGKFNQIALVYTNFVSMLSQTPALLDLLPLHESRCETPGRKNIIYESGSESVFNAIVPEYLGGLIYGALCESLASEQAARRTAMDAASKNADELLDDLNLRYNRARQGAITQEITEIVAGSEQS